MNDETMVPTGDTTECYDQLTADDARGFRAGRPASYERVFCVMWPRLRQVAWRIFLDAEEAQEAAQQGFVRACYARHTLRAETGAGLAAWLLRIVRHTALDTLRIRGRQQELTDEMPVTDGVTPGLLLEQRETCQGVLAALAQLDLGDRTVLLQCELEKLPHAEVAGQMGITVNVLNVRLHRARRRFREVYIELQGEAAGKEFGHG